MVSHINAHTSKGQEWLEQVVLVGLRKGGGDADWAIEVHGSDNAPPPGKEKEEEDDSDSEESPGPAVYLIFKRERQEDDKDAKSNSNSSDPPNIPLHFFNY